MRDLFPTGQTTISHSEPRSDGTSTSHSDSMSYGEKLSQCASSAVVLGKIAPFGGQNEDCNNNQGEISNINKNIIDG